MPFPASDGGAQVMHFTTQSLLSNGIKVKVVAINPSRHSIELASLPKEYIASTQLEAVKVDTRIKLLSFFFNLFRKESYLIERFISVDFEQKLKEILEAESFDIIQLEHLYMCKYLPVLRKYSNAKLILRPQNIEYIIWERYLKNLKNPLKKFLLNIATKRLKKYEQNVCDDLDGILALTPEDAELFSSFNSAIPVLVIPMGYDYSKLKDYNFEKQFEETAVAYHLGAMDWLPNTEAIKWFLEKVLPLLTAQNQKIKICLAGRNMPKEFYAYASSQLEILGEITAPLQYQENKPILIVPLWSGSGIRAKIIEGLALGKTIISTRIGAQGIAYKNGENMIIADTPEDFAKEIIRCIQSPETCKAISKKARELGMSLYNSDTSAKKMIHFYHQLQNKNG